MAFADSKVVMYKFYLHKEVDVWLDFSDSEKMTDIDIVIYKTKNVVLLQYHSRFKFDTIKPDILCHHFKNKL